MTLPQYTSPIYNIKIPSTDKVVKFRQFLVKEEHALLLAKQSDDATILADTLKRVLESCILDKIDVDSLTLFDIEYIFTNIRAKSVGEVIDLLFGCAHCTEKDNKLRISIDTTKIEVIFPEGHNKKIPLFDNVGVVMKYPTLDIRDKINDDTAEFDTIIQCIDYIYDGEVVHYAKEIDRSELEEFLNGLTHDHHESIKSFFSTMPKMEYTVTYNCPACNHENSVTLEGISDFF